MATDAITHIARHYIANEGLVYDIGASTGNIGRALAPVLKDRNARLIGLEPVDEMIALYDAPGEVIKASAESFNYEPFDLAIAFLCLMFVPVPKRIQVMNHLYAACKPGGAIIIFDKLEPHGGYISTILYRLALAGKVATGTSSDEIIAKELSLAGVQRPINARLLPSHAVQWFRFGYFAGYVIEKEI
jgi:tRNA (cmo5U34)-methyltransferase